MKKAALRLTGLFVFILVIFASCDNSDSYADRLDRERKNIKKFISEHNIKVLDTYPTSGVFAANEYFREPTTGVYINVIDSGNGKRASDTRHDYVNVRFTDAMSLPANESDTISLSDIGVDPMVFMYGVQSSYVSSSSGTAEYYYLSKGMAIPLKYVGEDAVVSLIVPFNSGSTVQQSASYPIFFTKLHYTKIIQ